MGDFHNGLLEESLSVYIHTRTCMGHLERILHLTWDIPASLQTQKVVQLFKNVGFKFGLNMRYVFYQCTFNTYI